MRLLQAGEQQLIVLEPDRQILRQLVRQAGFTCKIAEEERRVVLEVRSQDAGEPLLLFDALDPANLGWFSRCQFYVDGNSGVVLQTPLWLANYYDGGKPARDCLLVSLATELPAGFRLAGRQNINEQVVYTLLFNLLNALRGAGVAVCGRRGIRPLAGANVRF